MQADSAMRPTADPEIDDVLDKVRAATGKDWRAESHLIRRKGWFRKERYLHSLYLGLGDTILGGEFQIINFYMGTEWSLNTEVPAEVIVAFLLGILAGRDFALKDEMPKSPNQIRREAAAS